MKTDNYDPEYKYNNTGWCPRGPLGENGPRGIEYSGNDYIYTHTLIPYNMSKIHSKRINVPKYQKQAKHPKMNNRSKAMMRANRRK